MFPDYFFCGDFMYSRFKLSARLALSGSYLKILPVLTFIIFNVFIFSFINPAFDRFVDIKYISAVFSVVTLILCVFITSPARLHLEAKHYMLARGMKNMKMKKGFGKSLLFYPIVFCLKLFWLAVFEAVPVSGAVMLYFYLSEKSLSAKATVTFLICISVLTVAGIGFYSVFIQRYSKSAFYLACYEDFSVFDAIGESVRKTRGSLCEILFFKLGFLPWFLLCIGIVPMLFVIPYYKQSLTLYFLNKTRCS